MGLVNEFMNVYFPKFILRYLFPSRPVFFLGEGAFEFLITSLLWITGRFCILRVRLSLFKLLRFKSHRDMLLFFLINAEGARDITGVWSYLITSFLSRFRGDLNYFGCAYTY